MENPFSSADYVLMPWDDKTVITVFQGGNIRKTYLRWELIQKQLKTSNIPNVEALINSINSYNVTFDENGQQKSSLWKCPALFKYFEQLHQLDKERFFEKGGILSTIRSLALHLREFVPRLKLLKTGTRSTVNLHQLQIASILSSAFLCIFPKGKSNCPSINFCTLFEGSAEGHPSDIFEEKLKCLMHYFKRIHERRPLGYVSFHRLNIPDHRFPRWNETTAGLVDLVVNDQEKIEDKDGFLQMDFANRYIGGGVLGKGCVQEEIRFLISPELIAGRLFTECLDDNESVFVIGAERYCCYKGYSHTFAFAGNYNDLTSFDDKKRKKTYLIIIDALYFQSPTEQYRESKILRELKKAYVGFKIPDEFKDLPLATGNWGCGVFRGDPQLKFLLQLIASSKAGRPMWYLTSGDTLLKDQIMQIYDLLKNKAINIGKLYCILRLYRREKKSNQALFDFIREGLEKSQGKFLSKFNFYSKCITSTPNTLLHTSNYLPCSSESIKHTSAEKQSDLDTPTKEDDNSEQQPMEEDENFPELNLDFGALDREIQEKAQDTTTENYFPFLPSNFSFSRCSNEDLREPSRKFPAVASEIWRKNLSHKEPGAEHSIDTSRNSLRKKVNDEDPKRIFTSNTEDLDPCTSTHNSGSPHEVPSLLELIMKENENDCKSDKEVRNEPSSDKRKCYIRSYSQSVFSDDETEKANENPKKKLISHLEGGISCTNASQFPTVKCANKTGSAMCQHKVNKKKMVQRKITHSFFKK